MRDLVSFNEKHNEANGEGGADGESHNRSWNCGAEGETDDEDVLTLRAAQQRNFLTTMLLSQGVPMILHGDELGRTQGGNNNVYCQDNEIAWVDWDLEPWQRDLLEFSRRLVAMRRDHPVFRRRRFLGGDPGHGGESNIGDIAWFKPSGQHMTDADWAQGQAKSLVVFLNGGAIPEPDRRGQRVVDDSFLIAFNADAEPISFTIPGDAYGTGWLVHLDTTDDQVGIVSVFDDATILSPGDEFPVAGRSVVVLRSPYSNGSD
jgi:glycogen operon protein